MLEQKDTYEIRFVLVIDIFVLLFLGLMLVRCVPTAALVLMVKGCVLGSVTGGSRTWLNEVSSESWVSGAVLVIVIFALVPFAIYAFSLGHKWQKTTIIVISAVTVFSFWRSFILVDGLFDGFMEEGELLDPSMVLRLMAIIAVPAGECLVIMLLHRKVFPASWRKESVQQPADEQRATDHFRLCPPLGSERLLEDNQKGLFVHAIVGYHAVCWLPFLGRKEDTLRSFLSFRRDLVRD